jgi:hypothetical protein
MSDQTGSDPPLAETPEGSPPNPPPRYRVIYSARVSNELEDLIRRARLQGQDREVRDAAREIDRRLRIYPQFGQPLRDLQRESSQIWIGFVDPLVVQYSIHEDIRQVWVTVPIRSLPGFFPEEG